MKDRFPHTVLVILRNPEGPAAFTSYREAMAPFGLKIPVELHWGGEVTEDEKEEFLHAYINATKIRYEESKDGDYPDWIKEGRIPDFDEALDNLSIHYEPEIVVDWYNWMAYDDNGVLRWQIDYEDNAKGVWIGGGMGGNKLVLKENSRTLPRILTYYASKTNNHPRASDYGYKGDIENIDDLDFNSVILDGVWHFVDGNVYDLIKDLPDDVLFVCVVTNMIYDKRCLKSINRDGLQTTRLPKDL